MCLLRPEEVHRALGAASFLECIVGSLSLPCAVSRLCLGFPSPGVALLLLCITAPAGPAPPEAQACVLPRKRRAPAEGSTRATRQDRGLRGAQRAVSDPRELSLVHSLISNCNLSK